MRENLCWVFLGLLFCLQCPTLACYLSAEEPGAVYVFLSLHFHRFRGGGDSDIDMIYAACVLILVVWVLQENSDN